jgi:hypothetical protein
MDPETLKLFKGRLVYTIGRRIKEGSLADFGEFRTGIIEQAKEGRIPENDAEILFHESIETAVRLLP